MIINKNSAIPNSIGIPSVASFVVKIKSKEEVIKVINFASKINLPLWILGDGTNIIPHNNIKAVIAILNSKGIEKNGSILKVQAGEKWDNVVKFAVKNGLSGIEALSSIPGRAGSALTQNIGAYGSEISDCLESVEVYDKKKKGFINFNKKECKFGYRDSLFKKYPERFIIVLINLKLSKQRPKIPKYKGVEEYFKKRSNKYPNLQEIRKAIIEIRKNKLPNPNTTPNAGSYFINPIIKNKKIFAGHLIEEIELKGAKIGRIEISPQNALILTNPERAGFEEVMKAENFIRNKVFQKFGINLEREPRII